MSSNTSPFPWLFFVPAETPEIIPVTVNHSLFSLHDGKAHSILRVPIPQEESSQASVASIEDLREQAQGWYLGSTEDLVGGESEQEEAEEDEEDESPKTGNRRPALCRPRGAMPPLYVVNLKRPFQIPC